MNIFAKVILSSNKKITDKLVKNLELIQKENNQDYDIFVKMGGEFHTVLINQKSTDIEKGIDFVFSNFEVVNFYNIGTCLSIDSIDLKFGDVIVPNTIINKNDDVIFLENFTDKNYDLNKFGLVLNGICLTLDEKIQDEDELLEIKNDYNCDIFDFEAYLIGKMIEKLNKETKFGVVKIIGDDEEHFGNVVDILEFFM
ncbi:MAG: hypothetical protein NWP80_01145 [Candidatus Gracilibacteria bacterium]|nr:hypothetical protein [Candidatus Gracilibacteria bacterium]